MSVLAEQSVVGSSRVTGGVAFDINDIRSRFPILQTKAHGHPLVYLDNGATTQKPQMVIDAITRYYESENANIHRGVYQLSQTATHLYEDARRKVAAFINAADEKEIIFTRGTTEGINLVAQTWGRELLHAGDEVVISAMEHHSNIVPWQMLCQATGATLQVIPMNDAGELLMDEFEKLVNSKTKIVSVCHLSNSLGTVNDVKKIIKQAHAVGARVLVDGAQWVAHYPTDVQDLNVDFYVFSGHKLFGPTGIGVLYGKRALLEAMPPWQGGGDMIESVTFEKTTYAALPNKFEAGTPNIAGAVGLGAAIDFVRSLDFQAVHAHEMALLEYATKQLKAVQGLRVIGNAKNKGSLISFVMEDPAISSHQIGTELDFRGVAIRTGHHCCQPAMNRLGISSTARASFAAYNTREDVDALVTGIQEIIKRKTKRAESFVKVPYDGELKFPRASAESPSAAAAQLVEHFEWLTDPQARYEELLGFGRHLPDMPSILKNDGTRVHGCMSVVHIFATRHDDRLDFLADSDGDIVKGLIYILQKIFAGQSARKILDFDIEGFLHRIGLDEQLTMQRRNGLEGMIRRIRSLASNIADASGN